MSFNFEQRLDLLDLIQKINRALTSQHVARITQHFGLPASITEAGALWPQMTMRGKFNENNVWDLREFLIQLNNEDRTTYLGPIINEISYYHNRYRAWQRNDSIANPIVAPIVLNPPRCLNFRRSASGERIQCSNQISKSGTNRCDQCDSSSKTSHYELPSPVVAESEGLRGIPGPVGEPSPAVNLLGPRVGGSVGIPYYNHKRHEEIPIEEKEKECRLCMTNEKYVVMQPCGCVCLCGDCALTYNEKICLNCKSNVTYLQGLRSV